MEVHVTITPVDCLLAHEMQQQLQRKLTREFRLGELTPASPITAIPHVGAYLHKNLQRAFQRHTLSVLTIGGFASAVAPLSTADLKSKLQHALQNKRANQCVRSKSGRRGQLYHVQDYNKFGYEACLALIRVLAHGRDGYGMGSAFASNPSSIRIPAARSEGAKRFGCIKSQRGCRAQGGVWHDSLCQDDGAAHGFEGVAPYDGQKTTTESPGTLYAKMPTGRKGWRRPLKLQRLEV